MENDRRLILKELNEKAWAGLPLTALSGKKLDSSIKRNTGFIKKLKQGISKETLPSLLKDLKEVSLEKYLSEIIVSTNEALTNVSNKNEDIVAAIEVVSVLHQRFSNQFTLKLFELFLHNFSSPVTDLENDKEEIQRAIRVRNNLRLFTELYLVSIFLSDDSDIANNQLPTFLNKKSGKSPFLLLNILKEVLNYKFKLGYTIIIATSFCKKFHQFFDSEEKFDNEIMASFNISDEMKKSLKSLFKILMEAVFARTTELNKKIIKLMKEHQKCQIRTGKLRDEYIDKHDTLKPVFDRFYAASEIFVEIFNVEAPVLEKEEQENAEVGITNLTITKPAVNPASNQWDNEETRKFYEVLPDTNEVARESQKSETTASTEVINSFFSKLEAADTKEAIDELSTSYWELLLDNKATRKRLLKFFIETPDWNKLPVYARFVATNTEHIPNMKDELINYLDNGFRLQLHSDRISFKNIIFFSEMVKFMLIPKFMIFHKIRTLIMNMNIPNNVEILTVLFENLGKFLIYNAEFQEQMEKMVNLIKEKSRERRLDLNMKGALDGLVALVYPPTIKSLNTDVVEQSVEERFFQTIIRRELANTSLKQIFKIFKMAHWSDRQVYQTFLSLFSEPEKVHYQNISKLTVILADIYCYQKGFVVKCIDQVLENIDRGLEKNDYSSNLQRISNIRYLTELYNRKLVTADTLIETLYHVTKFGHPNNVPTPFYENPNDPRDNYFRIQMVTTSILNIERYTNQLNLKLEQFLRFFEFYIHTKQQPCPKETEFKLTELFELMAAKVNFTRASTLEESYTLLLSLLQIDQKKSEANTKPSQNPVAAAHLNSDKELTSGDNLVSEDEEEEDDDDDEEEDLNSSSSDGEILEIIHSRNEELDDDDEDDEDDDYDEDNYDDENSNSSSSDDDEFDSSDDDDDDEDDSDSEVNDGLDDDNDDFDDIDADRDVEKKRMYEEFQEKLKHEDERKVEDELEKKYQMMMQESIDLRKNQKIASGNIPMVTHRKPIMLRKTDSTSTGSINNDVSATKPNKIAFTFLTKAGKKTQSRLVSLPKDVKFVSDVLEEEQRLKNEREKIKNIVLQRTFE